MSPVKEPGPCPFCAWDHPGDPPHAQGCIIGPYVEFARAEGVAAERARVVADLRMLAKECRPWARGMASILSLQADRIERGEHDKEGT